MNLFMNEFLVPKLFLNYYLLFITRILILYQDVINYCAI